MSKFKTLAQCKCPRCRTGKMFPYSPFSLKRFHEMNEYCEVCKLRFETEPGFFYGAMYVSYAMVAAIFLSEWFLLYLLGLAKSNGITYLVPITVVLLLPFIFRYSRVIFLHVFGGIKFDESYSN